jgi:C4-dicarboxylate transporter DctM subunit
MGSIYILIGTVTLFTHVITLSGFPQILCRIIIESGMNATVFTLVLAIAVTVLTFFIDPWALMFMMIPILMPIFHALQVNLIVMGVTMCICTMIGYMTPPMAVGLYFASRLLNVPATEAFRGVIPFLIAQALVIPIVIFLPQVVLWLPSLLGFS